MMSSTELPSDPVIDTAWVSRTWCEIQSICAGCYDPLEKNKTTRGLCSRCIDFVLRHGLLDEFPRKRRPLAETVKLYNQHRKTGKLLKEIAVELGITVGALSSNLSRAKNLEMEVEP